MRNLKNALLLLGIGALDLDNPPEEYFPQLAALIQSGLVYWDAQLKEYAGIADDGTEVSLGDDSNSVEDYLKAHPGPEHW